jgi:hypothetical protein
MAENPDKKRYISDRIENKKEGNGSRKESVHKLSNNKKIFSTH